MARPPSVRTALDRTGSRARRRAQSIRSYPRPAVVTRPYLRRHLNTPVCTTSSWKTVPIISSDDREPEPNRKSRNAWSPSRIRMASVGLLIARLGRQNAGFRFGRKLPANIECSGATRTYFRGGEKDYKHLKSAFTGCFLFAYLCTPTYIRLMSYRKESQIKSQWYNTITLCYKFGKHRILILK